MPKKYVIKRNNEEREKLESIVNKGNANVRQIRHAPTLLLSNAGKTDKS